MAAKGMAAVELAPVLPRGAVPIGCQALGQPLGLPAPRLGGLDGKSESESRNVRHLVILPASRLLEAGCSLVRNTRFILG